MKTSDFTFELPASQIAQYPAEPGKSRLMTLDRASKTRRHYSITDLTDILVGPAFRGKDNQPPLMVFNNTRVRKARLKARLKEIPKTLPANAPDAGIVEFLLLNRTDARTWRVMVNHAKRRRPGQRFCFGGGMEAEIVEPPDAGEADRGSGLRFLCFDSVITDEWLDKYGHVPLPPYIRRQDVPEDKTRYQTVYADPSAARELGPGASAAAPTAGLHFTRELLDGLERAGVETAFVTLHVGLGTFLPVRAEYIEDHAMHEESYFVPDETRGRVETAKARGRKVLAVGTTSVRTLESAWVKGSFGKVRSGEGATSIFIYPGYTFNIVDAIFTNFHTPESTLLMLAAAFAGVDFILESYKEAIKEGYRFFSYGDACLIY